MEPSVITAIATVISALIGAGAVALPMTLQSRINAAVMDKRLEQLEEEVRRMNEKFERHEEHSLQIAQLEIRIQGAESDINVLQKQMHNLNSNK